MLTLIFWEIMKRKIKEFFKNEFVILIIGGIIINILCFLIGSCHVKAASQNNALPYIPQTDNLPLTDDEYAWITAKILEVYPDTDFSRPCIIFRTGEGAWYTYSEYLTCLTYNVYFPAGLSNNSEWVGANGQNDFNLYDASDYLNISFVDTCEVYTVQKRSDIPGNIATYVNKYTAGNVTRRFYGEHTQIDIDNGHQQFSFYQYYPCYTNAIFSTNSNLLEVVDFLNPGRIVPGQPGEPDEPDFPDEPTPPVKPNTPTPPVKPTINDISDLADYLESLFGWLINSLGSWLEYIGDYLSYLGEYIAGILKEGFNSIYRNFKNFFQPYLDAFHNLIDSIANTLETIQQTIEHFFQPFDYQQASASINNSSCISSIRAILTNIETFANTFSNTSEPENLTFTLDFRNNRFFNFGLCTLDFNVIKPFRSIIRLFIGCVLVFGLLITIATSLNAYIGGNSSKNAGE